MVGSQTIVPTQATGTITVVDYSTLSGRTVTLNGTTVTEGVDWTAAVSNDATAASLSTALEEAADQFHTVTGSVITITAEVVGVTGNTLGMSTNGAAAITLSGSTLAGGSSGIVGTSGRATQLYGTVILGPTATGGTLNFYDGTSTSGTLVLSLTYAAAVSRKFSFKKGIIFKEGCFVDILLDDAQNVPSVLQISYSHI